MIDISRIETYRENNRIEAKKALGGLPRSIWETYSAFANALGGVILLGVEEHKDHSLHTVDLPDPERLVREFWAILRDPQRISVNILSEEHVQIEEVDGNHIIVITVPRARRSDKPVYVGLDPMAGSYRRNGEGDYRCTREEVESMLRDAAARSRDLEVMEELPVDALSPRAVARYRSHMKACRPGHAWEELPDDAFLHELGALGRGADGQLHPTMAGLLMLGEPKYFDRLLPNGQPVYIEHSGEGLQIPPAGETLNLYAFYFQVAERLGILFEDKAVCAALREALVNMLINADYHGRAGLSVHLSAVAAVFTNAGAFRMEVDTARSGGVSDPRNSGLVRMFWMLNIGSRTGSGIPGIYAAWKKRGWAAPVIEERFDPERIILTLPFGSRTEKTARVIRDPLVRKGAYKGAIIEYLTDHISAKTTELAGLLDLSPARVRTLLRELIADGYVMAEGSGPARVYKLKV